MRFNSEYRPGARQFIGYAFLFSCHTLHTYTDTHTHSHSVDRLNVLVSNRIESRKCCENERILSQCFFCYLKLNALD